MWFMIFSFKAVDVIMYEMTAGLHNSTKFQKAGASAAVKGSSSSTTRHIRATFTDSQMTGPPWRIVVKKDLSVGIL